jgi:HAD superfamily hydrolase (TIGR01549 family)
MIKAIIFDFGQTLVDSAGGFRAAEAYAKTLILTDIFPEADSAQRELFIAAYRRIRKEHHTTSRFSRPVIWQTVYNHFGKGYDSDKLELWEFRYWQRVNEKTTPFPESLTVLENLGKRYKLGLITNTQGQKQTDGHRIALFPQLEQFFEVTIVAGEAGVPPKPDPTPFHLCLERLNVDPSSAVYVGDDWRIDVCGSRDAGLHPVWLKHRSVNRNWPDVEVTVPVIKSLEELLDMEFGAPYP